MAKLIQHISLIALIVIGLPATAAIVGWRTDGTGRYPDADPPTTWSKSENVVWKRKLPAFSNATPVIVGNRIFVCSEPSTIICVNAGNGKILWQQTNTYEDLQKAPEAVYPENPGDVPGTHDNNGYTSPTPVSDGSRVFCLFGNGIAACYDLDGKRRWIRFVQKPTHRWGHCASPSLVDNRLVVHVLDVFALDVDTGKDLWRAESASQWGSPAPARIGDVGVVIIPFSGDVIRAADGKKLASEIGKLRYATPVIENGIAYFIENLSTAVKLPQTVTDNFETKPLWQAKIKGSRHYASSVVHNGLIYAASRAGKFSVLDADDGKLIYQQAMGFGSDINSVYPSVTLAGNYIFIGCTEGITAVIKPGREYNEIARNRLEGYRSSPVFIGKRLYLRGLDNLYCIGKAE